MLNARKLSLDDLKKISGGTYEDAEPYLQELYAKYGLDEDQQEESKVLGMQNRHRVSRVPTMPPSPRMPPPRLGQGPLGRMRWGLWVGSAGGTVLTIPSRQRTSLTAPRQPRKPMSMVRAPTLMKT